MDLGLNGKVALVTGGSRGIGRACAARLARRAARSCSSRAPRAISSRPRRRDRRARAAAGSRSARPICARRRAARPRSARCKHAFGRLDVLVNNAGATQSGDFFKLDDALWEDGFALKFYSYVRLSRALWPLLKDAQGSVVNVIGAASKTPSANFMIGGAVNAAITNFTKALAELGLKDGVAVKAVHPGMTVTGRLESLLEQRAAAEGMSRADYERQELARAGLRRYSEPEDIAALVAFLASPLAQQIHGADVFIDGGATKTIL